MGPISTFVFMDLETTGLPREEDNKTRITEISMIAVKRDHFIETRPGASPRVQQKLTLSLNPRKLIQPSCSDVTGLNNDLLEHEPTFDTQVFLLIYNFLNLFTKPVCLISHNGHKFDFPILQNHLFKLGVTLPDDIMCADCLNGFYDILKERDEDTIRLYKTISPDREAVVPCANNSEESIKPNTATALTEETDIENSHSLLDEDFKYMQKINESTPHSKMKIKPHTPQKSNIKQKRISQVRRRLPWGDAEKPTYKLKLNKIYERLLNRPCIEAHRAENDCIIAIECAVTVATEFVEWIDNNHCPFAEVKPMTVGIRIDV